MMLSNKQCYSAVRARDPRFDGVFFTGVVTTGIYCRPICPARTPKRQNIRFFPCAAAAEDAGFRPCLRCRPETAPGTPAWSGTSATVSRAVRLIDEGALDDGGVESLATRLGIGSRHLRRLFFEHLGTTPVAYGQTRRLHHARSLLAQTRLPVTDIALAAGFGSIRRFNAAFREAYGCAPTGMRRESKTSSQPLPGDVSVKIGYRPPLNWEAMTDFLTMRAIPGVESVRDGVYRRSVASGDSRGVVSVTYGRSGSHLVLTVPIDLAGSLPRIVERVRRVFDLRADTKAIGAQLSDDPLLREILSAHPGMRVPGAWDPFETAVRAILGQQVSVKGATTVAGRLARTYGETLDAHAPNDPTHVFPTPERLARARLRGLGFPESRAIAIRGLAQAVLEDPDFLAPSRGLEEAVARLNALPGIGPWTAQYIAMRALGEPDAFPSGDLGLRKAVANGNGGLAPEKEVVARAEGWRPWRAYAAILLWHSLSTGG